MTNINSRVPEQQSPFNGAVASLFSLAILVMAGALTFAAFASA